MSGASGTDGLPPSSSTASGNDRPQGSLSIKERYRQNRDFDMTASWRDWLRQRLAKYGYGIGSLLLDGMVVGVVFQNLDSSQVWPYLLSIVLVVGLIYLEVRGLRHFWPPKSPQ